MYNVMAVTDARRRFVFVAVGADGYVVSQYFNDPVLIIFQFNSSSFCRSSRSVRDADLIRYLELDRAIPDGTLQQR